MRPLRRQSCDTRGTWWKSSTHRAPNCRARARGGACSQQAARALLAARRGCLAAPRACPALAARRTCACRRVAGASRHPCWPGPRGRAPRWGGRSPRREWRGGGTHTAAHLKQTRNAPEISRLPGRKCAPRCVLSAPLTTWAAPLATWAAWGTGARCTTARKDAVIPRTRCRIHELWSVRLAPCPSAPRGTDTRRALSLHRRCQQWPRPRPWPPPLSWWPGSTSVRPPLSRRSATGRPPALAPRWWPTRCRRSARPRTQVRARAARRGARWPVLSLIACTRP